MTAKAESARSDLMWGVLQTFTWLDRCLQENLAARGWQPLPRVESEIMIFIAQGTTSPIDIAHALGVSRQAINYATNALIERGLVTLEPDPADGRRKILTFARSGKAMRKDALDIIRGAERELEQRLGKRRLDNLRAAARVDLGEIPEIKRTK